MWVSHKQGKHLSHCTMASTSLSFVSRNLCSQVDPLSRVLQYLFFVPGSWIRLISNICSVLVHIRVISFVVIVF